MTVEDVVALYMANIIDRNEARSLIGLEEPEKPAIEIEEPKPLVDKPIEKPKRFTKSEVEEMTTKEFQKNRAAILSQVAEEGKTLTVTKDSSIYEALAAVLDRLED